MTSPGIDVIIAVYNGEEFIEAAIASVQSQTWKNVSIILADDGSTDRTVAIISKLRITDNRIKLLALPHRGVSETLNAAIKYSTAEYLAFLDADDLWHKEKLEKQMALLNNSPAEMCFCLVQEFDNLDQEELQTHRARVAPMQGYTKIAFLGNRRVFDTFGLFDDTIAIGDFVEWYSRVVRAEEPVIMLEEVLAYRRIHQHNTTREAPKSAFLKLIKMHLDEKRKDVE